MKLLKLIVVLIIVIVFDNLYCYSQNSSQNDAIVSDFENIVTIVNHFFESNPIFLDEQPFSSSPTGRIYQIYKHIAPVDLKYDIRRTESLISPITGYIIVEINNRKVNKEDGYPNLQECMEDSSFGYWHTAIGEEYIVPAKLTYNFAYRNGKWKFINIVAYGNEIYDDDWDRPENKKWLFLKNIFP